MNTREVRRFIKEHFQLPGQYSVWLARDSRCYQHPLVPQYLVTGKTDAPDDSPLGWGGFFCPACQRIGFVRAPKGFPEVLETREEARP